MADTSQTTLRPIILFPGQGGFDGEALHQARARYPQVDRIFERIDAVTQEMFSRRVSELLFGAQPMDLRGLLAQERWVSQVAIYGSSLAAYEILADHGLEPGVLVGHSLGEIAALVAAGAYSVGDGARIVIKRVLIIEEQIRGQDIADGRMVALSTDAVRAQKILDLVADPLAAVATENHDEQTVVSGPASAIGKVRGIAGQLGVGVVELAASLPFHTPFGAEAMPHFSTYLDKLEQQPLQARVYSPILHRYYESDDALPHLLAEHFVRPVKFAAALRQFGVADRGVFIEAGGRDALSKLAAKVVPGADVLIVPTLAKVGEHKIALEDTLARLRDAGLVTTGAANLLKAMLVPDLSDEEFEAFWDANRAEITDFVRNRLRSFPFRGDGVATRPKPAPVEPTVAVSVPEWSNDADSQVPDRKQLFAEIRAVYAEALEYPEEVFTGEVLLEAELGVDSVKQVELLTRVSTVFGLPKRESGFRLTEYDTMDKIADLILAELTSRNGGELAEASV
jgi:acyl transferase domain-containing protein